MNPTHYKSISVTWAIATFYFVPVEHSLTCVKYKLLITFQQVDVYLNEPIKIDEQIKLANQLIQRRTRD